MNIHIIAPALKHNLEHIVRYIKKQTVKSLFKKMAGTRRGLNGDQTQ